MVASRLLLVAFVASASASAIDAEAHMFAALLKRQEPGTPAYNCHDNCGTAITVSKAGGDTCKDEVFLFDYKNCLQCAGPDNYNIWRYYGGTLSGVASGCGLSTTPLSGKQPDVPEAKHPGDSVEPTSTPDSTPTPTTTPTTTPSDSPTEPPTSTPTDKTSDLAPTTSSTTGGAPATTSGSSGYTTGAPTTPAPSVSGVPSTTTNGTATFTSGAPTTEFTGAAVTLGLSNAAAAFGIALLGAAVGLGN